MTTTMTITDLSGLNLHPIVEQDYRHAARGTLNHLIGSGALVFDGDDESPTSEVTLTVDQLLDLMVLVADASAPRAD